MEHINQFIAQYGAIAFFILMFLDALFLPIPSQSILVLTSIAAAQGDASLSDLLIASFFGTMCGSCFAYGLGRVSGYPILIKIYKFARIKPDYAQKFEDLIHRRGAYLICVARFIVGIRRIYAIVDGAVQMNFAKFFVANLIGAILWLFVLGLCPYLISKFFT